MIMSSINSLSGHQSIQRNKCLVKHSNHQRGNIIPAMNTHVYSADVMNVGSDQSDRRIRWRVGKFLKMCNLTSDSPNRKYSLLRKFRVKKLWKCFGLKFTIIILLDFISSIITSLLSFIFLDAYQEKKFDFHCLKHVNAVQ